MKQEVIQDFLNLPGIAGVALMDGRSRPYFLGVDRTLNFQQKEALAQGILQVIETIPEGFESFEFQFTGHQVHIYKLDHGIILLVLTRNDLVYSDYLKTIKNLKAALQEDIVNAIATFRLVAGNVTLSQTDYRKRGAELPKPLEEDITIPSGNLLADGQSVPPAPPSRPLGSVKTAPNPDPVPPSAGAPRLSANLPQPKPPQANLSQTSLSQANPPQATQSLPSSLPIEESPSPTADVTLKDLIAALNHLSQFTTQYLGTHVIVNYWKSTCPVHDWLTNFQVDRSGQFSFSGATPQELRQTLSPQEQAWIREWVAAFMKRCSQVIRDFPAIVEQKALNDEQKPLLLG